MKRFFFEIAYDGKHFSGWQRQPQQRSVQETIEVCLSRIYSNLPIEIIGCGRTDAGVHAMSYFFHVNLPEHSLLIDLNHFQFKLNRMLPESISIYRIFPCEDHARFDARTRTYRYFISLKKDPFKTNSHLYTPKIPDFDKMNAASKYLVGKQDFTSLSKLHTDVKTNICTIIKAQWERESETTWYFEVTADRFLRNMVRSAVGTILEVGWNNLLPEDIIKILEAKDRGAAAKSVPAHGLFLWHITYDFNAL